MKLTGFRGVVPRTAPRLLDNLQAQVAENVVITSGELAPAASPLVLQARATSTPLLSIFKANDAWFSWEVRASVCADPLYVSTPRWVFGDGYKLSITDPVLAAHYGTPPYPGGALGSRPLAMVPPSIKPQISARAIPGNEEVLPVTRAYAYTYIDDWHRESAPSPVSELVTGPPNGKWTINMDGPLAFDSAGQLVVAADDDEALSNATALQGAPIVDLSYQGNTVTVGVSRPHGLVQGSGVTISGVSAKAVAPVNGDHIVTSVSEGARDSLPIYRFTFKTEGDVVLPPPATQLRDQAIHNATWTKTGVTASQGIVWSFRGTTSGFGYPEPASSTFSWLSTAGSSRVAKWTTTGANPSLVSNDGAYGFPFAGSANTRVVVRARRLSGSAAWEGKLYYKTAGHGYTEGYYKSISDPIDPLYPNAWHTMEFDMSALTAGGADWTSNDITGLRLDLVSGAGDVWEILFLAVAHVYPDHNIEDALAHPVNLDTPIIYKMREDGSTGKHGATRASIYGKSPAEVWTVSFDAVARERTAVRAYLTDNSALANRVVADFNLTNGQATASAEGTGSGVSAAMEWIPATGGWRCHLTGQAAAAAVGGLTFGVEMLNGTGDASYTGTVGHGMFVGKTYLVAGGDYVPLDMVSYTGVFVGGGRWDRPQSAQTITRRLYRSAGSSSQFQLVADNLTGTYFVDTLGDGEILGDELISAAWVPPPANLKGLFRHSAGHVGGYAGQTVHFSEAFQSHGWPAAYQLKVPDECMGVGEFRGGIVVATNVRPYIFHGEPGLFAMEPVVHDFPCVSEASVLSTGDLVGFAAPHGYVMIGPEGADTITNGLFTRDEWYALEPERMHAAYITGKLYFTGTDASTGLRQLYCLDAIEGTGLTTFPVDATALHPDYESGVLHYADRETLEILRLNPPQDTAATTFTWHSKEFVLPGPVNLGAASVQLGGTNPLTEAQHLAVLARNAAVVSANVNLVLAGNITGWLNSDEINTGTIGGSNLGDVWQVEQDVPAVKFTLMSKGEEVYQTYRYFTGDFRLPSGYKSDVYSVRLESNVQVKSVDLAETMTGLRSA